MRTAVIPFILLAALGCSYEKGSLTRPSETSPELLPSATKVTVDANCNIGLRVDADGPVTVVISVDVLDPNYKDPAPETLTFTKAGAQKVDVPDGKSYVWYAKVTSTGTTQSGAVNDCEPWF